MDGLSHGLQTGSKGPAFESSEKRAIVLIPNIVKLAGPGPVDALLHLHGFGTGYRELKPGKHDHAGILQPGQLRDVDLYQMPQKLLSHAEPQAARRRRAAPGLGDVGLRERRVPKRRLPDGGFRQAHPRSMTRCSRTGSPVRASSVAPSCCSVSEAAPRLPTSNRISCSNRAWPVPPISYAATACTKRWPRRKWRR